MNTGDWPYFLFGVLLVHSSGWALAACKAVGWFFPMGSISTTQVEYFVAESIIFLETLGVIARIRESLSYKFKHIKYHIQQIWERFEDHGLLSTSEVHKLCSYLLALDPNLKTQTGWSLFLTLISTCYDYPFRKKIKVKLKQKQYEIGGNRIVSNFLFPLFHTMWLFWYQTEILDFLLTKMRGCREVESPATI